jgi:hypothetical protein
MEYCLIKEKDKFAFIYYESLPLTNTLLLIAMEDIVPETVIEQKKIVRFFALYNRFWSLSNQTNTKQGDCSKKEFVLTNKRKV